MSQGTPPPTSPPSSSSASHQPQPPMVYALPPRRPGFLRTVLGVLTRLILIILTIFFALMLLVGIVQMLVQQSAGPRTVTYRSGDETRRVAVLDVNGTIDQDTAEYVRSCVDHVLKTPAIKAVVLRVNSPGGGITASDHIWYQVKRLKNEGYPVVASYGEICASGGVYASCHSDFLFAEPTTITGSIGVLAQVMTFGDLLDKVGVEPITLVARDSPDKATANDVYRPWTEEDKAVIRKILDAGYETFFNRVWEGRKHVYSDESELREVADGSIYTAEEAVQNKLVDAVGYLDDAIDFTIQQASLPTDAQVVRFRPWSRRLDWPFGLSSLSSLSSLFDRGDGGAASAASRGRAAMPIDPQQARLWWYEFSRPRAMFLMPG